MRCFLNRTIRNIAVVVCLALIFCESGFSSSIALAQEVVTTSQNDNESGVDTGKVSSCVTANDNYELGIDADEIESYIYAESFRKIVKNNLYLTKDGKRMAIDPSKVEITNIQEQHIASSNDINPKDDNAIEKALEIEGNKLTISLKTEIMEENGNTAVVTGEGKLKVVETAYNVYANEIEVEVHEEIISPTGQIIPNSTYKETIKCLKEKLYAQENNRPLERYRIGSKRGERFRIRIFDANGKKVTSAEIDDFFEKIRPGDFINYSFEWYIPEDYEYVDDPYDDKPGEWIGTGGRTHYYSSMKRGHSPIKFIESDQSGENPDDQSGENPDDQSGENPDDQSGKNPDDPSIPQNDYTSSEYLKTVTVGGYKVTYPLKITFTDSKKAKLPAGSISVVGAEGKTYSVDKVKLRKATKVGTTTFKLTVKGASKEDKRFLKKYKFDIEIVPYNVSASKDNISKKTNKKGEIKKVTINGIKLKKNEFRIFGSRLVFDGRFKGSISVN